jgi:eukaryotic-like serine/threonine-protein kinase
VHTQSDPESASPFAVSSSVADASSDCELDPVTLAFSPDDPSDVPLAVDDASFTDVGAEEPSSPVSSSSPQPKRTAASQPIANHFSRVPTSCMVEAYAERATCVEATTSTLLGGEGLSSGSRRMERDDDQITVVSRPPSGVPGEAMEGAVPGSELGRYVVVEHVGSGAMGHVVRAYDPRLRREVAIKRVRSGSRDEEGQARLLREARAMAQLSHPNVVAVYDVEAHDRGIALAMEYVAGGTLSTWVSATPRTFVEILDVLRRAGEGLAAAHRVELVHRDFKPANILVADDGRVKVTDFGLAKPFGSRSDDSRDSELSDDGITHAGTVMGTPRYMAPEQHQGKEADARTDQYAYCVTLWESLTGSPPFSGPSLASLDQAKRAGPPPWPKPSEVPASVVAALRRGLACRPHDRWPDMHALISALDLWRGRRRARRIAVVLGTAGAMAAGIIGLRALEHHRAVQACAARGAEIEAVWPGRAGDVRTGMADTDLSYAETTWTRTVPWLDEWAQQWQRVRTDSCTANVVTRTMSDDLHERAQACLDASRVEIETVLELLAAGDPPAIRGAVSAVASQRLDSCADPVRLAHGIWSAPAQRDEIAALRRELARAGGLQSAGRYDEGHAIAQSVLDSAKALAFTPLVAEARVRVGTLAALRGEYDSAAEELRTAYFEAARIGTDLVALAAATDLVFTVGHHLADLEVGLQWGEHARVAAARVGDEDPIMTARLLHGLAAIHRARGAFEESRTHNEQALAIRERVLGREHPDVAAGLSTFGRVVTEVGDHEEAKRLHERALEIRERILGPDHPNVASSLDNLAIAHRLIGDYQEAKALHHRARGILEASLGPDHPSVATNLSSLAVVHIMLKEYEKAMETSARSLEIREQALGDEHPSIAYALDALAAAMWPLGHQVEAVQLKERALAIRERAFGAEHQAVAVTLESLAGYHGEMGNLDQAKAHYERVLAIRKEMANTSDLMRAGPLLGLAQVALSQSRPADAVSLAEQVLAVQDGDGEARLPSGLLASVRFVLAQALWNDPGERPRALEIARLARDEHRNRDDGTTAAEIDAWLKSRTDETRRRRPSR